MASSYCLLPMPSLLLTPMRRGHRLPIESIRLSIRFLVMPRSGSTRMPACLLCHRACSEQTLMPALT